MLQTNLRRSPRTALSASDRAQVSPPSPPGVPRRGSERWIVGTVRGASGDAAIIVQRHNGPVVHAHRKGGRLRGRRSWVPEFQLATRALLICNFRSPACLQRPSPTPNAPLLVECAMARPRFPGAVDDGFSVNPTQPAAKASSSSKDPPPPRARSSTGSIDPAPSPSSAPGAPFARRHRGRPARNAVAAVTEDSGDDGYATRAGDGAAEVKAVLSKRGRPEGRENSETLGRERREAAAREAAAAQVERDGVFDCDVALRCARPGASCHTCPRGATLLGAGGGAVPRDPTELGAHSKHCPRTTRRSPSRARLRTPRTPGCLQVTGRIRRRPRQRSARWTHSDEQATLARRRRRAGMDASRSGGRSASVCDQAGLAAGRDHAEGATGGQTAPLNCKPTNRPAPCVARSQQRVPCL